jgi:hypothetical protein
MRRYLSKGVLDVEDSGVRKSVSEVQSVEGCGTDGEIGDCSCKPGDGQPGYSGKVAASVGRASGELVSSLNEHQSLFGNLSRIVCQSQRRNSFKKLSLCGAGAVKFLEAKGKGEGEERAKEARKT